jgi:hypothetical protein
MQLSGGEWAAVAVVWVVGAVLGYWLSERDRRLLGRTPWGLPSAVWAFLWLFSLLLGFVLFVIAHAGEVRRVRMQKPPGMPPPAGQPMPMARRPADRPQTVAELFPAYPRPANSQPPNPEPTGPPGVVDPAPETPSTGPRSDVNSSPPAWHPDPSGRFHYRWWDGSQWTSQVSTDGHHLIDTNPDQRIGPY